MTIQELHDLFEKHAEELSHYDRVEGLLKMTRPDVQAFLLLERLCPSETGGRMVEVSEHDEIWLGVDVKELAAVCREEDVILLLRCGITLDPDINSLHMFM